MKVLCYSTKFYSFDEERMPYREGSLITSLLRSISSIYIPSFLYSLQSVQIMFSDLNIHGIYTLRFLISQVILDENPTGWTKFLYELEDFFS
jgi:hypothetical protein